MQSLVDLLLDSNDTPPPTTTGVIPTIHFFLTTHLDLYNAHKGVVPPASRISALDTGCFGWRKLVQKPILLSSLYDLLKNFQSLLCSYQDYMISYQWRALA